MRRVAQIIALGTIFVAACSVEPAQSSTPSESESATTSTSQDITVTWCGNLEGSSCSFPPGTIVRCYWQYPDEPGACGCYSSEGVWHCG